MNIFKTYFTTLIIFFAVDLIWLGLIAKRLYRHYIGYLLASSPNWVAAIVFYSIYIVGLVYFAISPGLEKNNIYHSLKAGMFFGFITYATYDLTNLATIKNWPLEITIIDLIWGTFLCGIVSFVSHLILKNI